MIDRKNLPYRQGVVAYVRNSEGKYLIYQDPKWKENEWRFPGGGLEKDEDYITAIKREIFEEFGIENVEIAATSTQNNRYEWPDDLIQKNIKSGTPFRGQEQKQVLILIDNIQEIKADPNEVKAYKWILPEEFEEYFVFNGQADLALKVVYEFMEYGI
jgi:putative (di)nucleoside polyphosphate hydrolase